MGRNQSRAIELIEETIADMKIRKFWHEDSPYIDRSDFIRAWNRRGFSLTLLDSLIAILKSEFILSVYSRQTQQQRGYYFNQKLFDEFKKKHGGSSHA